MDKNSCTAIFLCLVVFLAFEFFILGPQGKKKAEWQKRQAEKKQREMEEKKQKRAIKPKAGQPPPKVTRKLVPAATGKISNDMLELEWTNYGAALSTISLIGKNDKGKYLYTGVDWESPLKLTYLENSAVVNERDPLAQRSLLLRERLAALGGNTSTETLADIKWEVAVSDNRSVTFSTIGESGINIEKKIALPEKGYLFDIEVTFSNTDNRALETAFDIGGAGGIINENPNLISNRFVAVLHKGDEVTVTPLTSVTSGSGGGCGLGACACGGGSGATKLDEDKPVRYAGLDNTYFGLFMIPVDEAGKQLTEEEFTKVYRHVEANSIYDPDPTAPKPKVGDKINACVYFSQIGDDRSSKIELKPGEAVTHRFQFFAGPKIPGLTIPAGVGHVYDYDRGWFWWLADVFYWILRAFYAIFRNYGVAIIVMTALIRLALHPISKRQTASMEKYQKQMQEVKPELDALKEKYKGNQKKFLAEQQKLFRERGMSMLPLGGCLPMLLQLPVFIGLWRCLGSSIELRHQAFIPGWISDLSQPDTVAHVFSYPVNILPIACVAVMMLQFQLQPKPQDKQQQASQRMMMLMMPVLFGFMFYSLPSGLTLYFFASTLVGLLEHKFLKKKREADETAAATGPPPDPTADKPGKKKGSEPSKEKDAPFISLAKQKKQKKPKKWPYR